MNNMKLALLVTVALLAIAALEVLSVVRRAEFKGGDLAIVVAFPWRGGPSEVVRLAGGRPVGTFQSSLSVLSTGANKENYIEAGALFVLDPVTFFEICGVQQS
jgi:hypothetical protein